MNVLHAPILDGRHCRSLSFVADLKPARRKYKSERTKRWAYERSIVAFISKVNALFVGEAYTRLTGKRIAHGFNLQLEGGGNASRVSVWFICPQGVDYSVFQSSIFTLWARCPAAGDNVFIDTPRTRIAKPEPVRTGWFLRTFGETAV